MLSNEALQFPLFFKVSNLVFLSFVAVRVRMGEVLAMPISLCDCHLQCQVGEMTGNGGAVFHHLRPHEHMQF